MYRVASAACPPPNKNPGYAVVRVYVEFDFADTCIFLVTRMSKLNFISIIAQ